MIQSRPTIIQKVLSEYWSSNKFTLTKLAGDAGTREYYRSCSNNGSVIIMDRTDPYEADKDPFCQITRFLTMKSLPVPELLQDISEQGILLIEDLGDHTLQHEFEKDQKYSLEQIYPEVLSILARMHSDCRNECISSESTSWCSMRFDFEKLFWELEFFREHFIEGYRQKNLTEKDSQILDISFREICHCLDQENPMVFTHRDFHSRNIMVCKDRVRLIDYQDARLGLPEYDLSSLLRDAYVQLPEEFIEYFLEEYYRITEDARDISWRRAVFSFSCLQRNIKALGTFGYQATHCRNHGYLQYLPILKQHINRELDHLQHVISASIPRLTELDEFRRILNELLH